MILTKGQISAADDRKIVELEIPEWGGSIRIREMSAADRIALAILVGGEEVPKNAVLGLMTEIAARSIVDEKGDAMYTKEEADELFSAKSYAPLERIVGEARKLSVLSSEAVEEERKNSPGTPGSDSSSG